MPEGIRDTSAQDVRIEKASAWPKLKWVLPLVAVVLVPLTLLIGRQVPLIAAERARFGPVLAVLSWIYFAGALQKVARARRIAIPFAYAAGLAVGFWSGPEELRKNWAVDKTWQPDMDSNVRETYYRQWKKAVDRTFDWVD